jgi:hypothetical protein
MKDDRAILLFDADVSGCLSVLIAFVDLCAVSDDPSENGALLQSGSVRTGSSAVRMRSLRSSKSNSDGQLQQEQRSAWAKLPRLP